MHRRQAVVAEPLEEAQNSGLLVCRQARSREQARWVKRSSGLVETVEILDHRLAQNLEMLRDFLQGLTSGETPADFLTAGAVGWRPDDARVVEIGRRQWCLLARN